MLGVKFFNSIFLLFLFSAQLSSQEDSQIFNTRKNYALFFAVEDYSNVPGFSSLNNPVKDAYSLAEELWTMYSFQTEIYINPTSTEIETVLGQWQRKVFGSGDQLFVFFTGHGAKIESKSKGYFVAANNRKPRDEGFMDYTDLRNMVDKIPCEHILLALDACFSGYADPGAVNISPKSKTFRRPGSTPELKHLFVVEDQLRNKTRRLLASGLEETPDGKNHSPFTEGILRSLKNAYVDGAGLLLVQEIEAELLKVRPKPWVGFMPGHMEGGFVFLTKRNEKEFPFSFSATPNKQEVSLSSNDYGYFYDLGRRLFNENKFQDALLAFNNAFSYNSREEDLFYFRGHTYCELGKYEKALEDFNEAISIDPNDLINRFWRGELYFRMEKYLEGITDFNAVIQGQPDKEDAYYYRAQCYYELEDYKRALRDFNTAIQIDPDDDINLFWRGNVLFDLENYSLAISDLSKAIDLNSTDPDYYYYRAQSYYELEEYGNALKDLNQSILLDPSDDINLFWRGHLFYHQEKIEEAIRDFSAAIKLNSSDEDYFYYRAQSFFELRKYDEALNDLSV